MKTKAIFPGTFDPFTRGHLYVVKQALTMYDEIVIGVGSNHAKEKRLFKPEERVLQIERTLKEEKLSERVSVARYTCATVDFALRQKATHVVRGVRNQADRDDFEEWRSQSELLLESRREHLDFFAITCKDKRLSFVSSSVAKMMCNAGEFIAASAYVGPVVFEEMVRHYLKQHIFYHFPNRFSVEKVFQRLEEMRRKYVYSEGKTIELTPVNLAILLNLADISNSWHYPDADCCVVWAAFICMGLNEPENEYHVKLRDFLPYSSDCAIAEKLMRLRLDNLPEQLTPEEQVVREVWQKCGKYC